MASIAHQAAENYAKAGFANTMGWGSRPVLIMVDVCKAYWTTNSPLDTTSNAESAASPESMKKLVAAARKGKVPVVWTRVAYSENMKDAGLFYKKTTSLTVWQQGDKRGFSDWVEGLEPSKEDFIFSKKYPSAFFGTTLATDLHVLGCDTVVICGVSTSGCVRATTLDAMCYGYRPMIVPSACGDRTPEIHAANIFDLNAKYADAVSEEATVEKLEIGWL